MKVLMVNNRLKVYGGEGTYMTSLGDELIKQGHDVQYFGLKDPDEIHGNRYGIYAKASKNPFKLIKNGFNRKQFAKILDAFKPDIVHLNLIYFTLTPSILIETNKRNIRVVQTIHDGKMVCPSYQLYLHNENKPCTLCVNGDFNNCFKHKCHKNSKLFSYIAFREAEYNKKKKYYELIDKFIFPSNFMRKLHLDFGLSENKTEVLCNFSRTGKRNDVYEKKEKYVLFFGRLIKIKGIEMVAKAASLLPQINFVVAGDGDESFLFNGLKNCRVTGFLEKEGLSHIIENAYLTLFPSVCLENCPMSIAESISLGTPVLGSNIGGVPELIDENKTGLLFDPSNIDDFVNKIRYLYEHEELIYYMSKKCIESPFLNCEEYAKMIEKVYLSVMIR